MADKSQRLTKRQQRLSEKKTPSLYSLHMDLKEIQPITENQKLAFNYYNKENHMFLLGCAGTGKTYISVYLALKEIIDKRSSINRLIIVRTAQPTKNIGFLKGDTQQKIEVYEAPYRTIINDLFGRDDAYDILKLKKIIDFQPTSFLRGVTFDNAVILLDEVQSMSQIEWITVLTRVGNDSRVMICGDTKQDDLTSERFNEKTGIYSLIDVFSGMQSTKLIEFVEDDIVRSGFVKELIISMNRHKI